MASGAPFVWAVLPSQQGMVVKLSSESARFSRSYAQRVLLPRAVGLAVAAAAAFCAALANGLALSGGGA